MTDKVQQGKIFTTMGANNHSKRKRADKDYYATDPIAIDRLLMGAALSNNLWECACGDGSLSKRLEEKGYNVYSTDLYDWGYGETGIDFLKCEEIKKGTDIITNPPYILAQDFIEKALDILPEGQKAFFFLKILFLESKKRRKLYEKGHFKHLYVCSERIACAKDGDFEKHKNDKAIAFGWYEFEKGYKGQPTISWI